MFCPRRLRKVTIMEEHYRKNHKENFTWIECKLCRIEHREEEFKDHIRRHNDYPINGHYMNPEKLEDDDQAALIELEAVDKKSLKERMERA